MLEAMLGRSFLALAACGGLLAAVTTAGAAPATPCTGAMLSGTFKAIPGSPGMGHISYRLSVTNTTSATCFVTGVPQVTLLDRAGKALPTHGRFSGSPGELTAIMVSLAPGKSAHVTARFSPDVPGPGEPQMKPCEPTAYKLRVAPSGGGSLVAPITPPTMVCEHGSIALSVFTR